MVSKKYGFGLSGVKYTNRRTRSAIFNTNILLYSNTKEVESRKDGESERALWIRWLSMGKWEERSMLTQMNHTLGKYVQCRSTIVRTHIPTFQTSYNQTIKYTARTATTAEYVTAPRFQEQVLQNNDDHSIWYMLILYIGYTGKSALPG